MKFTKLRLIGFKSFVEPSEFIIERGLTGVVGPNGCGKSNLVEAIRWVMGENSYKNMRASGMDDVIFSGSGNRPARNTAEVGLHLDNSDRTAPAGFNDHDEIQVTRRIEREAGSVYRINGKEARAKDVQLLFADASTGARSPSMVGQGRIGELIQAKPQARRQLLEEAAGISGLHSRRHEAELRLRAAETNLERLDDVTGELRSQIDSLKRQARQANRFKQLSADIRAAEATLLHIRWIGDKKAEGEAQSILAQATSTVAERAQAQMEAVKAQAIGAHRIPELRDAAGKAGAALQRLEIARTQLDAEVDRITRRREELQQRLAQLVRDIAREEALITDNKGAIAKLDAEQAELKSLLAASVDLETQARAAVERTATALTEAESVVAAITAERAEAAAARNQQERSLRDLTDRETRTAGQLRSIEKERDEINGKIAGLPDPEAKRQALEAVLAEAETLRLQLVDAETVLEQAREREPQMRGPLDKARAALNAVETEARTIRKMLAGGAGSGAFPAAVESMRVDRGFEKALGAALGDDLDQPLDERAPAHWRFTGEGEADGDLPEGVRSLANHVDAPQALARRLRQVGLVEASDGPRIQALLKPGQRIVTRNGALWRWDGFVAGADAPTAAALRLEQKNRLAELDAEAVAASEEVKKAEAAFDAAKTAVQLATEAMKLLRGKRDEMARQVDRARDASQDAERAAGQFASRKAVLDETHAQTSATLAELSEALAAARAQLAEAPDLSALDQRLSAATLVLAQGRTAAAEARSRHDAGLREKEARGRRIEAIDGDRKAWMERAAGAEAHIAELKKRQEEASAEAATLDASPDDLEEKRVALLGQLKEAERLRREARDRLNEADARQKKLDQAANDALSALASSREERGRAEERLHAARERREEIEARIRDALGCHPHEAIRHTGLGHDQPLPDALVTDRRLEQLKVDRERLGAVNLRAEAESQELSERLDQIVGEREDVIEAIRKLRGAIQSLNREGRERLLAAFEVVDQQFRRLFTHLFGGGTAELQLVESDDPLEAGLEILARPPGKKPQTMTLLSGGEQALTAMALIFAVFLTNPAPICVLDEVDAPLDDHNVERFCNLMDEMAASTETRFILITHNPITMARMNRLFGVTMAEQGVSQLVSVDLETAEQIREAS
ncbi:chromosome segregation protein SMC [Georhizobium profundi]|uniref:Chromosome partition protein Smc n=1 Tax=Georhizobium profundi TaxID=2341112 RepID=A0A3Q8XQ47_9HYPH|nr:chromosome segregation protein SMC [Georhizobium profundi]AZN72785.1 chromosome segregation protein SMC [Georhizobium profundi]